MIGARLHLPVQTSPHVRFHVGECSRHLDAGSLYEIDNSSLHFVKNGSSIDRIHLIFNLYRIDRQVEYFKRWMTNQAIPGKDQAQDARKLIRTCGGHVQERIC